ncbi:MAG: hypothetical protein JAZ15_21245, partial [Candidatus Thiodiazotropha endolucinida]|nr:hypothetical protein [Candidatus Thiodiazotropha taylori]MCW4315545.1 hypothetical protein [Candidatus Thiodiazotropha taylori]
MSENNKSPWNSLEVVKLVVSAMIPALILYFGSEIRSDLAQQQAEQSAQAASIQRTHVALERVTKWRFGKFEELSGLVNDMFVYYIHVGKWKIFTPLDIVERKREVDKIIYATGPIFSEEMIEKYHSLISEMFQHYQGWGEDAALRTSIEHRKDAARKAEIEWKENWNDRFTGEDNRD